MTAPRHYYNEIDPSAAQWLRNLMAAGVIYPGDVDERSIEDVTPADLAGYTQCHFFAGIAGWQRALQLASWAVDRPVWTGSCPCQPFSAAGKGLGFADERHLWPAWFHLVEQCRPPVIFGEQVASAAVNAWVDLVHADLEGVGYAFRAVPFPAAGVGAPHIRDRSIWAAHAHGGHASAAREQRCEQHGFQSQDGGIVRLGDAHDARLEGFGSGHPATFGQCAGPVRSAATPSESRGLADAAGGRRDEGRSESETDVFDTDESSGGMVHDGWPGPVNGFWRAADWLLCRDGKWRPVEPGTFPLAHGISGRVGRLRAYGNAIVPPAVAEFIKAYMDCQP